MHVLPRVRILLPLAACLGLPWLAAAQAPPLRLPDLAYLQEHAVQSVNVTLDPPALNLAGAFMDDKDPEMANVRQVFQQITSVTVRSFQLDKDLQDVPEIDSLRRQLDSAGWTRLVQVHDRHKSEDVGVYLAYEEQRVRQLVVLAVNPREITLVHIAGDIDPARLAELRRSFEHHDQAPSHSEP
jgi:ABC-type transporter Mla MlaB component